MARARRIVQSGGDRVFVMDKWRYHPALSSSAALPAAATSAPSRGLACVRNGWGNGRSIVDPVWHLAPHDLSIALEVLGTVPTPRAAAPIGRRQVMPYGMFALLGADPWVSTRSLRERRSCGEPSSSTAATAWPRSMTPTRAT
ncbi:MAG: hypothetical protein U0514_00485 [Candidatus Andersenbacteria bacterium]